jgi:hypothetical protein
MSSEQDYEIKLETLRAIPKDQIKIPNNIPVYVYIQEADNLYQWCQQDKDALTAVGLAWELVTDLPLRIGALTEAEARWNTERLTRKEAPKKWEKESKAAYDLRNRLLHQFRYAYRKDADLLKAVKAIGKGRKQADMIQDLSDLSVLGEKNPQPLSDINFDMSLLDKATETAEQMALLLAQVTSIRNRESEAQTIRDQAFTHLKEAVDQVCECGQYVFRQAPERRRGYRSHYMYMRRKRHERKAAAEKSKIVEERGANAVGKGSLPRRKTANHPNEQGM